MGWKPNGEVQKTPAHPDTLDVVAAQLKLSRNVRGWPFVTQQFPARYEGLPRNVARHACAMSA
jgi:hypothetical protein